MALTYRSLLCGGSERQTICTSHPRGRDRRSPAVKTRQSAGRDPCSHAVSTLGNAVSLSHSGPSGADPQEPTYHNVPAWVEMQPVYGNGEAPAAPVEQGPRDRVGRGGAGGGPGDPSPPDAVPAGEGHVVQTRGRKLLSQPSLLPQ